MKLNRFLSLLSVLFLLPSRSLLSLENPAREAETLNRIIMIVGDEPVTGIDLEDMKTSIASGRIPGLHARRGRVEDQALEELIARAIVDREADDESIIISETRIENEIQKRKELSGIESDAQFQKEVENQTGLSFDVWVADMRYQLKKRQLIQLKVNVPRPEDSEVEDFYNKNRANIGVEVSFREIILRPSNGSIVEERRISKLANDLRREIAGGSASFSEAARTTAENISPLRYRGGFQGYTPIQEVAARHQMLAGLLFSMRPGQLSGVYRDSNGNYFFTQLVGKRPVPLSKVSEMIRQKLYFEQEEDAFQNWIRDRKKNTSILCLEPAICSDQASAGAGGYYPGGTDSGKGKDSRGRGRSRRTRR